MAKAVVPSARRVRPTCSFRMLRCVPPMLFSRLVSLSPAAAQPAVTIGLPSPAELGRVWDRTRLPLPLPPLMRHPDVVAAIEAARMSAPDLFQSEVVGSSVEGRSINHVWFGRGPLHVLLWSQMHGDEPTATVALFDVLNYIQANRTAPHVARMLDRLTAARRPDAQPRRRRTATATQRAGHRHQPRRAAAADAGGARAQGAARPAEPAHRLQPPQPELAHVGRQDGQAGGDVAAGRVV